MQEVYTATNVTESMIIHGFL